MPFRNLAAGKSATFDTAEDGEVGLPWFAFFSALSKAFMSIFQTE